MIDLKCISYMKNIYTQSIYLGTSLKAHLFILFLYLKVPKVYKNLIQTHFKV